MSTEKQKQNRELKQSVLERLESEQIQPTSKMWWRCQECLMWAFWCASILFGAFSVAVLIYASTHARYALYEATHDSVVSFIVEALPYAWIGIFVVMAFLAHKNMRNTKRGYRYTLVQVLGSSLVLSIILGALLYHVGVAKALDSYLGKMMPIYVSQEKKELYMWQNPDEGRLVGHLFAIEATSSIVSFEDSKGIVWAIETADLHDTDLAVLLSGKQTRLLGIYTSTTALTMHACGAFPWMFDKSISLDEMEIERRGFVERMYAHKDLAMAREEALDQATFGDRAMGMCADMPAVRRIGEGMR